MELYIYRVYQKHNESQAQQTLVYLSEGIFATSLKIPALPKARSDAPASLF